MPPAHYSVRSLCLISHMKCFCPFLSIFVFKAFFWKVILGAVDSIFWLRLGLWREVLTWSVCMLLLGKTLTVCEYQKETFSFVCFMAVLLFRGSNWDPRKSVNHRNLTIMLGGVILTVKSVLTILCHAHPPCSFSGGRRNLRLLSVSGPHAELEGSQSGRSACSVLCTSSGRSFGLLFAWPG